MPAFIDRTGKVFGKLTVVMLSERKEGKNLLWVCKCDCGNSIEVTTGKLTSGNTKSCGCLKSELLIKRNSKHQMSKLPEYSVWKDMKKRCYNKSNKRYKNYSEKGITVCEEWRENFQAFFEYIGSRPNDGQVWTIGRIDNNLSYQPGNVRWELLSTQARNHSLQTNNKSGICGVHLREKVINGVTYSSWVATWNNSNGIKKTKEFSVNKYGYEEAKQLAISYRKRMIEDLKDSGILYAESHGTVKDF